MKHIRNYYKAKRLVKKYHDEWIAEAERSLRAYEKIMADPANFDGKEWHYPKTGELPAGAEPGCWFDANMPKRCRDSIKGAQNSRVRWERRLEAADKAGTVREMRFDVEWKKSRTWGSNPRAEVWIVYDSEDGGRSAYARGASIGGCGYDKLTTAMEDAMHRLPIEAQGALDRWVLEGGLKLWEEYAIGKSPYPHFEFAGKGISTFTRLFRQMGVKAYSPDAYAFKKYVINEDRSSDSHDSFFIIRKDKI